MSCIYHLVYLSKASDGLTYSDVQQITSKARLHNAEEGITGLLTYHEGYFLQLLEGDEIAVKAALSRIIKDTRHRHMSVLVEVSSPARLFEGIPAAFFDGDLNAVEDKTLIDKIFNLALSSSKTDKNDLLKMVTDFYQKNLKNKK